jgi:hypothetical protein
VLHCRLITPLHEAALDVLGLHVFPEQDIDRGDSLELLYFLLGIIPAYRWGWGVGVCLVWGGGGAGLTGVGFRVRG